MPSKARSKAVEANGAQSTALAVPSPAAVKLAAYDENTDKLRARLNEAKAKLADRTREVREAQRSFEKEHGPIASVTPADFDSLKNLMTRLTVIARGKATVTLKPNYSGGFERGKAVPTSVARRLEAVVGHLGKAVGELTVVLAEDVALTTYPDQEQLALRLQGDDSATERLRSRIENLDRELKQRDGWQRRELVDAVNRAAKASNGKSRAKATAKAEKIAHADEEAVEDALLDDDELADVDGDEDDLDEGFEDEADEE